MTDQRKDKTLDKGIQARLDKLEARGRDGRWWRRVALALIVAAVSIPLAAGALGPVPNIFASGEVISATEMNENFAHLQDGITAVEDTLPTGAVAFFDLDTCPTGWSAFAGADGRTIVGGARGTNVGAALASGASLTITEVPAHGHAISGGGSVTSSSAGDHRHSAFSGPEGSHTHTASSASGGGHNHTGTTRTDSHDHSINVEPFSGYTTSHVSGVGNSAGGAAATLPINDDTHSHSFVTSSHSGHNHGITVDGVGRHTHTVSVNSGGAHTHTVDTSGLSVASTGTAGVDVTMPYVQLLACRRD